MKYLLFDLDGTLTDPFEGITKSVAYSLKSFGIEVDSLESLKKFIGPPLDVSFHHYYGMDESQSQKAVEKYREYFKDKGIFENAVYDGMTSFLQGLKDDGYQLYVCTSKPKVFAKQIIEHYHLASYFEGIYGSELDGTRKNKKDVIAYCIKQQKLNYQECIMIGDREHDVIGAHENNMPCIGVLYGYGDLPEFKACHCDYIVKDLKALRKQIDDLGNTL